MTDESTEKTPGCSSVPSASLRSPAVWIATGFGVGLVTCPPGTIGTLVLGMPLAWAIGQIPGVGLQILVIAALFIVGIPIATAAGNALGGKTVSYTHLTLPTNSRV